MLNKRIALMAGLVVGSAVGASIWYRYARQPDAGFLARVGLKSPETLADHAVKDLSKVGQVAQEQFAHFQEKGLNTVSKSRKRASEVFDHAKANIVETMDHEFEAIAKRWPS